MIINSIISGNSGETASIFVTGLSATDTVTATKDGKTYSGEWNGTAWVFLKLKEYGTYTITATDGTNTATQDVLVDMATQYDIQISYFNGLKLYWYGDECEDVTGGYVSTQHTTPQGSGGTFNKNTTSIYVKGTSAYSCGEYGCRTSNKIDFSQYKTLHINILSSVKSGYYSACAKIAISSVETYDGPTTIKLLSVEGSPTGELELDISGISNTPYYLLVVGLAVNGSITIDKIWLE